jgi:hypothetical protein
MPTKSERGSAGTRESLERAYRATAYHVFLPDGEIILRVGWPASALDDWLRAWSAECWSVMTAWNPGSRRSSAAENEVRQEELCRILPGRGYPWFLGENRADAGDWPTEPTFLILASDEAEMRALARRFGQDAILRGGHGEAAWLDWVRE